MTKFIINLDKKKCIGCGSCHILCETFFEIDENGLSNLKGEDIKANLQKLEVDDNSNESFECAKNGEESCPVGCIKVEKN